MPDAFLLASPVCVCSSIGALASVCALTLPLSSSAIPCLVFLPSLLAVPSNISACPLAYPFPRCVWAISSTWCDALLALAVCRPRFCSFPAFPHFLSFSLSLSLSLSLFSLFLFLLGCPFLSYCDLAAAALAAVRPLLSPLRLLMSYIQILHCCCSLIKSGL